jgi:hypothetical protein
MGRYFFEIPGQFDDPYGESLPDNEAALAFAVRIADELKSDVGLDTAGWKIRVLTDERLIAEIPVGRLN